MCVCTCVRVRTDVCLPRVRTLVCVSVIEISVYDDDDNDDDDGNSDAGGDDDGDDDYGDFRTPSPTGPKPSYW